MKKEKEVTGETRIAGNRPCGWDIGQATSVRLEQLKISPAIVPEVVNKYKGLCVIIPSKGRHRMALTFTFGAHYIFKKMIYYFMYVGSCLHVCLCTKCVPGDRKPEKGVRFSELLQLKKVVGFHVGKEIKPVLLMAKTLLQYLSQHCEKDI